MSENKDIKTEEVKKPEEAIRPIDPEHDARLHLKNEPHAAPGEYDPKYNCYRTQGG